MSCKSRPFIETNEHDPLSRFSEVGARPPILQVNNHPLMQGLGWFAYLDLLAEPNGARKKAGGIKVCIPDLVEVERLIRI